MSERRRFELIKSVLIPVASSLLVGSGGSYVAVFVAMAKSEQRLQHLESAFIPMGDSVLKNQLMLAGQTEYTRRADSERSELRNDVRYLRGEINRIRDKLYEIGGQNVDTR